MPRNRPKQFVGADLDLQGLESGQISDFNELSETVRGIFTMNYCRDLSNGLVRKYYQPGVANDSLNAFVAKDIIVPITDFLGTNLREVGTKAEPLFILNAPESENLQVLVSEISRNIDENPEVTQKDFMHVLLSRILNEIISFLELKLPRRRIEDAKNDGLIYDEF